MAYHITHGFGEMDTPGLEDVGVLAVRVGAAILAVLPVFSLGW
jgi:hypothetical protein